MDTSLGYATIDPLPADERAALREFVDRGTADYEWWAEPLLFLDDLQHPGHLAGSTELCLRLDDPAVDSYMASIDFERIVRALESASARFRVGWELALAGKPTGRIVQGRRSPEVDEAIQDLLQICELHGLHPEELDREAILEELRHRVDRPRPLLSLPN